MATFWGAEDVHRLIALFRSNEVLIWRANHKEYGKRGAIVSGTEENIRVAAWVDGVSLDIVCDSGIYTTLTGCDSL